MEQEKTEKTFIARFDDGSSFEFGLSADSTTAAAIEFAKTWNEMAGGTASLLMVETK